MKHLISLINNLLDTSHNIENNYIKNVVFDLIKIIHLVKTAKSNNLKRMLFESFCIKIKILTDKYNLRENIYFIELNKLRNIITHAVIHFETNENGIIIANDVMQNEIIHNKYIHDKDGVINYIQFTIYYILLLSREINSYIKDYKIDIIYPNILDKETLRGLEIIKEYNLEINELHDEYIKIIHKIHKSIEPNMIGLDKEYIEDNLKAEIWFKENNISNYAVDYMHTQISLGINLNTIDKDKSLLYLQDSLNIIEKIKKDYPFVTCYLLYIFNGLSSNYFLRKNGNKALEYAEKSINILESDFHTSISIYTKIIINLTFANALSINEPKREKIQLEKCIKLLIQAKENKIKNLEEYSFNIFTNYLKAANQSNFKINNEIIKYIDSFKEEKIKQENKKTIYNELFIYYAKNLDYNKAYQIVNSILKRKLFNNEHQEYYNYEKKILNLAIDKKLTIKYEKEILQLCIDNNVILKDQVNNLILEISNNKKLLDNHKNILKTKLINSKNIERYI